MSKILSLVKARLGIRSEVRDEYLKAIINAVCAEFEKVQGITPDLEKDEVIMLVVDMATFRYNSKGENGALPEHLYFRLRNLYLRERVKDEQ